MTAKGIKVRSNKIQYKATLFKSVGIYISALFLYLKEERKQKNMETFLILIVGVLIAVAIYQGIQIRKLRRQTIQAFLKVCERAFKKGEDKKC